MDLIAKLYQNENFPIYLGIIIIILLIIFFIVFMLGRKDSEEELKSKQLNKSVKDKNTFKEESTPVAVETKPNEKNIISEENNLELKIEENIPFKANNSSFEEVKDNKPLQEVEPMVPLTELEKLIKPVIPEPPVIENKDLSLDNTHHEAFADDEYTNVNIALNAQQLNQNPNFNMEKYESLSSSIEKELAALENKTEEAKPLLIDEKEVLLPSFKDEGIEKHVDIKEEPKIEENPAKRVDVFSSVYVPKREDDLVNDTMQIELPKLKK